jgi:hypothetical protein
MAMQRDALHNWRCGRSRLRGTNTAPQLAFVPWEKSRNTLSCTGRPRSLGQSDDAAIAVVAFALTGWRLCTPTTGSTTCGRRTISRRMQVLA